VGRVELGNMSANAELACNTCAVPWRTGHNASAVSISLHATSLPTVQAVVNEDTDGDRAALKREIKRLNEELAAARRQLAAGPPPQFSMGAAAGASGAGGFAAPGAVAGEPQSGTPARLHAQADALLSATSPTMGQEVSCGDRLFELGEHGRTEG